MALYSDMEEAKKSWKKTSGFGRFLLIISTFLAISSVASLSDIVFQWKGFILDGINFYRYYITTPLVNFLSSFGFILRPPFTDMLVILMLGVGGQYRRLTLNFYNDNKSMQEQIIFTIKMLIYVLFMLFGLIFIFSDSEVSTAEVSTTYDNISAIVISMFAVIFYPIIKEFNSQERARYYSPIVITIITVLLLAAINIGLTKST